MWPTIFSATISITRCRSLGTTAPTHTLIIVRTNATEQKGKRTGMPIAKIPLKYTSFVVAYDLPLAGTYYYVLSTKWQLFLQGHFNWFVKIVSCLFCQSSYLLIVSLCLSCILHCSSQRFVVWFESLMISEDEIRASTVMIRIIIEMSSCCIIGEKYTLFGLCIAAKELCIRTIMLVFPFKAPTSDSMANGAN